ncbi:hypothetical protein [Pyxidicoccus fallax]|uniref:hypothetical protein n=1 Tax=Pyxidicoccus fallax TaxID=394095 RepID=UPI001B7D5617|nr:hypothetical protein [Pyxidicoccus fallax]
MEREWSERLSLLQGGFYVATGLWPIVHLRSFEAVTGPKLEGWLVKTVGALITVIGGTLMFAGRRRSVGPEVRLLGTGSAAAFTAVDLVYTAKRRISPVYLLDAVAESALIAGWCVTESRLRARSSATPQRRGLRLMKGAASPSKHTTVEPVPY